MDILDISGMCFIVFPLTLISLIMPKVWYNIHYKNDGKDGKPIMHSISIDFHMMQ